MFAERLTGLNLYTSKVPIRYLLRGPINRSGKVKMLRRCVVCDTMKTPSAFGKLVRNICKSCVNKIVGEE